MIRMYAGGWDCGIENVTAWIAKGKTPDAIYANYEEAVNNAYWDAHVEPDEVIYFLYEDGRIEEFTDW